MKDFEQHTHICPTCKQTWCCHATVSLSEAMEDGSGFADCRWFTQVVCPRCTPSPTGRQRTFPNLAIPTQFRDAHAEAARKMYKTETLRRLYGGAPGCMNADPNYNRFDLYLEWTAAGYRRIDKLHRRLRQIWESLVRVAIWLKNFDPEKPGAPLLWLWDFIHGPQLLRMADRGPRYVDVFSEPPNLSKNVLEFMEWQKSVMLHVEELSYGDRPWVTGRSASEQNL